MKLFTRKFRLLILSVSIVLVGSCAIEEDSAQPDCNGCSSSSPWSTPNASSCYATEDDCEAAEGSGCQLCE